MRVMLFDKTCTHFRAVPLGLSHSWVVGGGIYRSLGRFDAFHGVSNWTEGLQWLSDRSELSEVQFWGHGHRGMARIGRDRLDAKALRPGHPLHAHLCAVRERMTPQAQWWFRTCDTLGGDAGHAFAQRWTGWFGRPLAGHTHIIGVWQSGLHRLEPGNTPHWPASEGVASGTSAAPEGSVWSTPWAVNTVHCLQGTVPAGW